jgi:hypothetical protein
VQEVVAACEIDLTLGLATADEGSWTSLIHEQRAREPAERVRHRDRFDRIAALALVAAVGLRAVVVGEVAGALHGWPLILSDEGTLDLVVHPEDRALATERSSPRRRHLIVSVCASGSHSPSMRRYSSPHVT